MSAIIGFTEMLRSPSLPEDDRQKYISIIERNGRHLLALITDILDISKVEAGRLETERIPFDLPQELLEIVQTMSSKAEEKGLVLHSQLLTPLPQTIVSDPTKLRQTLINLLHNAIKFTGKGSVTLQVEHIPGPFGGADGGDLKFTVIDTGCGIPNDQRKNLFEPFVQADSTTTRCFGGTGLGLALSRRFAEAMGGRLELDWSEPGKGSAFCFTLTSVLFPGQAFINNASLASHKKGIEPKKELSVKSELEGCRVLIAEDGIDNQELMKRILEIAGASVSLANDGEQAIEMALIGRFDVVLMDIQMPKVDGYEAMKRLRTRKYAVPIVALTAHAFRSEREKCLQAGCSAFLSKPFTSKSLVETVRQVYRPQMAS